MLKKHLHAIFACLLLNTTLFAQNTSKVDSTGMITLRIDPKSARGATVSQLFDDVQFIPLETNKESLFGSISQMEIVKGNFVIYDSDTKSILIFSKEGKFITKINAAKVDADKEDGPKEAATFYGFTIKNEKGESYIVINSRKYAFYFDINGNRFKKALLKDDNNDDKGIPFGDSITTVKKGYLFKKGVDSTYYEIGLLKNNKPVELYFPYSANRYKEDQYFGDDIVNSSVPNELFYLRSNDFNIYKITPQKLSLAYRIIFPASNSLPADFLTNPIYKNKRYEFFDKNKDVYFSLLGSGYKIGNNLFLKLNSFAWGRDKKNTLIYHLNTGDLTSISDMQPDSLSSFLPVTDAGAYYDFMNHGFHLYREGYLYTSYSSLAMFAFKEQSAGKNATYNSILSEYFKTGSKTNNPVIVALKPKKD